nr:hypothetical protein [Caldalkalibacillus mannanilyticus]
MMITTGKQRVKIMAELANQYAKLGNAEKAEELFQRAVQETDRLEEQKEREAMFAHLANEFASINHFDKALAYLDRITNQEVYVKTIWKLVNKIAKAGNSTLAENLLLQGIDIAQKIETPLLKSELLTGSGASYRHIDYSRGVALVEEAYQLATQIEEPYHKAILFNEIGANYIDVKEKEKALEVFSQAHSLVAAISSTVEKAQVLAMLGGELAEKGREKGQRIFWKKR